MSDKWRWHFAEGGSAAAFGADPADLSGAKIVRDMEGERTVYYRNGVYFKLYHPHCRSWFSKLRERLSPTAKQEFDAITLLRRRQVEVVEPIAWGVCGTRSMLLTREEKNCTTVMEYLHRRFNCGEEVPEPFLAGWSRFLARFIASGLYFPDFHCGNILYNEEKSRFVLVDPQGFKRNVVNRPERILRMLKREFGLLFEFCPKRTLVRMLAEIFPADPEGAYLRILTYAAGYVKKSSLHRDKRLKRFRAGAATLVENGVRIKYSRWEEPFPLEGTERIALPPEAANELWERDYILSLYHLPLLRVAARDEAAGPETILYRWRTENGEVSDADREALYERLALTGFRREEFDCCVGRAGTALLRDRKFAQLERKL